jgi:hypothetical protein
MDARGRRRHQSERRAIQREASKRAGGEDVRPSDLRHLDGTSIQSSFSRCSNSGSRAMFTAIRRTSSSVSIFACSASVALSSSSLTRSWLRWGVAPNKLLVDRPKRRIVRVNDARLRGKIWRVARPRRRAKLHPLEARTHVTLFFPIRMAGHVAAPGRSSRKH